MIQEKKMKIIFWTASFLPDLGGMQWSTYRLAKGLKRYGHEILFLTRESKEPELVRDFPIIRLPGLNVLDWTINSGNWLLENKDKFDVVHTIDLFYQAIEPQLDILNSCGKPTVLKIPTAGYIPKLINSPKLKKSLQAVSAIIALNGLIEKELAKVGVATDKIYRLPNGIDPKEFVPVSDKTTLRKSLGLPIDKVLLIFTGRLVQRKRLDILLSALDRVDREAHLVLVGSGFEQRDSVEDDIVRVATDLGRVTLIKAVADCRPYLQASDIQILLAEREGMPNSLLEGMSCSLPTIATEIAGIVDLISEGAEGILVPVGEVEETVTVINVLVRSKYLRDQMGSRARNKVIERFNISSVVGQYNILYRKIIPKGG
jgi:glycosyltransferase involved in cell wall biosynthesis